MNPRTRENYLSEVAAGLAEARAGIRRAFEAARQEHFRHNNHLDVSIMDDMLAIRNAVDAATGKIVRHEPDWANSVIEGERRNRVAVWENIKPEYKRLRAKDV